MARRAAKIKPVAKKKAAPKKAAFKKAAKKVAKKVAARRAAPKKASARTKPKGVNPIPPGLHSITANLVLRDCAKALAFYQEAFGAKVLSNMPSPDGNAVWHAALQIGDSQFFANDPMPGEPAREPSGQLWIYGKDVDGRFDRAVKAGCKVVMPLSDAFWGDRWGMVVDPFGQAWSLAEHKQDLTLDEMRAAGAEFAQQMAAQGQPGGDSGMGPPPAS